MKRILLSWSSGKDSAWSLHVLRERAEYEVVGLLTTFNEAADRVAMHAVRRELVEQQAAAVGLPLQKQLQGTGLQTVFPVWWMATRDLAREMIAAGVRAKLTCVDTKKLNGSFAGCEFDEAFLADLPEGVDPCGERGEFHSFVYAGPMFNAELRISVGGTVVRDQFVFADVIAA